jgi:D-lactate dehydrogenase
MRKITFYDAKFYDEQFFNQFNNNYNFKINYLEDSLTKETAIQAKDSEVVCIFVEDDVNKEIIDLLIKYNVKLIALRCAGYNNIDIKYAKDKVKIVRVPSYSPSSVAEHAFALI